jgi:hypothetical protein
MKGKITSGLCTVNRLRKKLPSSVNDYLCWIKYYAIIREMDLLHHGPRYNGQLIGSAFHTYIQAMWKKLKRTKGLRSYKLVNLHSKVSDLAIYMTMFLIKCE